MKPDQMIAYLHGHYRELSRQGTSPEVYYALGRYEKHGSISNSSFKSVLEHISQNIKGSILVPQFLLLNHSISLENALVNKRLSAGIQYQKLSNLLKGNVESITHELESLRTTLESQGYVLHDKLFRTIEVKEYEILPRKIQFNGEIYETKPFTQYVVQDKSPVLFGDFLSQNLHGLEKLIREGPNREKIQFANSRDELLVDVFAMDELARGADPDDLRELGYII